MAVVLGQWKKFNGQNSGKILLPTPSSLESF